jgi:alanine racemase
MSSDPATRAGAILEIDLGGIVANWRLLAEKAAPAACAAVVKANSYGLGVVPVARALAAAGCRLFFVATLDEGIALRGALGPDPEIAVFNGPLPGTAAAEFALHRLIPVLNDPGQIEAWRTTPLPHRGRGRGPARQGWGGKGLTSPAPSPAFGLRPQAPSPAVRERNVLPPAILHIDTGMARLGLTPREFAMLADELPKSGIAWRAVISHLACADTPDHPLNEQQRARFAAAARRLPGVPAGLAASSGVFLGPPYHFELVRPGAALYGVNPQPGRPNPLRQVVRLSGKILQVREIDWGESVGSGAAHVMKTAGRAATVAVGYADGWLRSLSHRGCGYIAGKRIPLLGRVSMDLVTFDVSAVDPALAYPGAMVELLGEHYGVDDAAADAGTIGYEILTALGGRYHRIYRDPTATDRQA